MVKENNRSTSDQTNKLITDAQINACAAQKIAEASQRNAVAAESFATSAGNISTGVSDAAKKLGAQALTTKEALHVSERAYVTIEEPQFQFQTRDIILPIVNSGHIPSGKMTSIIHSATYTFETPGQAGDWSNPTDKSWQHTDWASIPTGNHTSLLVPLPLLDESRYNSGTQIIAIAGTLSYRDGFSDTPERIWQFCFKSVYHTVTKKSYIAVCNATDVLPQLEKADGYPNNEHSQ